MSQRGLEEDFEQPTPYGSGDGCSGIIHILKTRSSLRLEFQATAVLKPRAVLEVCASS